jgi:uncharacterized protein YndB with AHSA1/START domain
MNDTITMAQTRSIVVEEVFPHVPALIWRALTDGDLIGRFLMPPSGFAAVPGTQFTLQTKPAGAWDGTIRCEVIDVVPQEKLVYSWKGGDAGNIGYGSLLSTLVTWTLSPAGEGSTRLRLEHSGFELPRNETAYSSMSDGWKTVVPRLGPLLDQLH